MNKRTTKTNSSVDSAFDVLWLNATVSRNGLPTSVVSMNACLTETNKDTVGPTVKCGWELENGYALVFGYEN
ncbi:hypothetical protein BaRGS_00030094 [Batillaria attramentaria]|uniref:Uncharacterized protein n=1 Tax=Batillaria attramentaria TaxID=370345 RepID=A0ABD0JV88_9CAEN